jgi:hypothetical protein
VHQRRLAEPPRRDDDDVLAAADVLLQEAQLVLAVSEIEAAGNAAVSEGIFRSDRATIAGFA